MKLRYVCAAIASFGLGVALAALPPSGQLSFSQIQTEFGGSNPISISEYYRGGARVPNTGTNAGIPTSGQVSISDYYGGSAVNILLSATGTAGTSGGAVGYSLLFGTMSPTTTTDSKSVVALADVSGTGTIQVQGFGADPGQTGWAVSVTVNGTTLTMASATNYSYGGGSASWEWSGNAFGFVNGSPFTASILGP